MLVYEFVPNNPMEFHLHGKGRPTMDWATRLRIALGSAKGLAYIIKIVIIKAFIVTLRPPIFFLMPNMKPRFWACKFLFDTNTHVSTRVMGTFRYITPEYAASGKLSEKSSVFSFEVMILELITGRRPVDTNNSFTEDSKATRCCALHDCHGLGGY